MIYLISTGKSSRRDRQDLLSFIKGSVEYPQGELDHYSKLHRA
jgi:hypothetical protein